MHFSPSKSVNEPALLLVRNNKIETLKKGVSLLLLMKLEKNNRNADTVNMRWALGTKSSVQFPLLQKPAQKCTLFTAFFVSFLYLTKIIQFCFEIFDSHHRGRNSSNWKFFLTVCFELNSIEKGLKTSNTTLSRKDS